MWRSWFSKSGVLHRICIPSKDPGDVHAGGLSATRADTAEMDWPEGKDVFREAERYDADKCLTGGSARAGGLEPDGSGEDWEMVSTENFCYISVQNYEFLWLEGATVDMRKMMWVK